MVEVYLLDFVATVAGVEGTLAASSKPRGLAALAGTDAWPKAETAVPPAAKTKVPRTGALQG